MSDIQLQYLAENQHLFSLYIWCTSFTCIVLQFHWCRSDGSGNQDLCHPVGLCGSDNPLLFTAVSQHIIAKYCALMIIDARFMKEIDTVEVDSQCMSILCHCLQVAVCLRVFCFSLVFVFNAVMWTMFVKSLQKCSSVIATVTNTASNFFFTVSGPVFISSKIRSVKWWCIQLGSKCKWNVAELSLLILPDSGFGASFFRHYAHLSVNFSKLHIITLSSL